MARNGAGIGTEWLCSMNDNNLHYELDGCLGVGSGPSMPF